MDVARAKADSAKRTRGPGASTRKRAASKKAVTAVKNRVPRKHRAAAPRITLSFISDAVTVFQALAQLAMYVHAHSPEIAKVLEAASSFSFAQLRANLDATRARSSTGKRKGAFDAKKASAVLLRLGGFSARFEDLAKRLASEGWIAEATDEEADLAAQLFAEGLVGDHGSEMKPIVVAAYRQWKLGRLPPARTGNRPKVRL